ncbi:unnamed protein product [Toxocara canis]|uniref:DUF19 domain-containing protein n=1 Tax=Toxocara canis TaxID=6265 RepID=A0A183U9P3_TOXCA|nr:unnamed protein product [Toxocara canis]
MLVLLKVCGGDAPYMSSNDLAEEHERCHNEAIRLFKCTRKMGGADFSLQFLEKLDCEIERQLGSLEKSGAKFFGMWMPAAKTVLIT